MIYFDNNATTELLKDVRYAIQNALKLGPSNPSSAHQAGDVARGLMLSARETVADFVGCSSEDIFFTSGGTEANNWVLHTHSRKHPARIVTTSVEHESIRKKCELLIAEGIKVIEIPVDKNGVVILEEADKKITSDTSLVSVQWVNNETGVIQPIETLGSICRSHGIPFHTDAAQAVGKIPINISSLPIDYMTFTGHKFHAPKGIGILYKSPGSILFPMLGGGTQESSLRPGTENLIGIVGIGKAAEIRMGKLTEVQSFLTNLRDDFEHILLNACEGISVNSQNSIRVCNTSNILFPGIDGQALMAQLNSQSIYCSQGSACTAHFPEPSHVLMAMGLPYKDAFSSIRFSFSELNKKTEIKYAAEAVANTYIKLRSTVKSIRS